MNESEDKKYRLAKLMSEAGLCSRREGEVYIANGWVKVNGEIITNVATSFERGVDISLDKKGLRQQDAKVTILLYKPVGYVSAQPEKDYLPAIKLILPKNQSPFYSKKQSLQSQHFKNLVVAGRLDIDSRGLLVFTQDGRIAKKIIGEDSHIEKEYIVKVKGNITEAKIKQLCFGLSLDGQPLKPAIISQLNENTLKFILKEGKKRQIRRMSEAVDLEVTSLLRLRVGKIELGRLKEGQWRFLNEHETF